MSDRPAQPASFSGPQDCGAFFIDAVGPYLPQQVFVTWTNRRHETNDRIEQVVAAEWRRRTAEAEAGGRPLWNGPLCRLIEYQTVGDRLGLTLGPTDYRSFVGTNLYNKRLRYFHGPHLLANPVGMSAVVISSDRYILLGRRSQKVAFHADRIHPVAGRLEPASDGAPDPFTGLQEEILEELALGAERIAKVVCLGLVRDKSIFQPELIFDVSIDTAVEEIRRTHKSAAGRFENSELVVVRDQPASVVAFIETNIRSLTPVGTASLLLHGMVHWGSGWFASTRGYLRSLI